MPNCNSTNPEDCPKLWMSASLLHIKNLICSIEILTERIPSNKTEEDVIYQVNELSTIAIQKILKLNQKLKTGSVYKLR